MTDEAAFRTYSSGKWWVSKGFATTTHPDYIEARFPLETRRMAWSDIQDFEIRRNKLSGEWVVVRLSSGRRIALPCVDSRSVSSVADEVRALRELWEQLR
ncbi:PH domain-containing protein [Streptomyces blattellae]|uniref:PH domain-containing protein n=1 Tax=Streptomyces blattellae TaxID=2569855 RepID=UPI0012B797ED|nr:PH domain-containing protein [Streptomyces blattellae]